MILPKSNRLTPEQLAEITAIAAEFGCKIQPIVGAVRTIYAIVGDERDELMINRLEGLGYIDRIDRIQSPFKLMDRRSDLANGKLALGGVTLGEELFVIAGHVHDRPEEPDPPLRDGRGREGGRAPTSCAAACGSPAPTPTPSRATSSRSTS